MKSLFIKLSILFVYFLVLISYGIYSFLKIKKSDDFYVAKKRGNVISITGSLLATILGGTAIIGTANWSYGPMGWASSWYLICGIIGLIILLPIAKYVKRYGKYTLTQLIGDFYGKSAERISSIIIVPCWILIIAAQMMAAGKILSSFIGISYIAGVGITGSIFIIYTLIGGQFSIIRTDIFQMILIIFGLLVIFILSGAKLNFDFEVFKTAPGFFHKYFGTANLVKKNNLVIWFLTVSTTYFVGPDMYSRLFCSRDEKTATKSVFFTILILIPCVIIISSIGIMASKIVPGADTRASSIIVLLASEILPVWLTGLIIAGLLAAVMSSADTTLLTSSSIITDLIWNIHEDKTIKLTRFFIIIIGLISAVCAVISYYFIDIVGLLVIGLTVFASSFIIPVLLGLLKFKTSNKQVVAAMLTGGIISAIGKIFQYFNVFKYFNINFNVHLFCNILIILSFSANFLIIVIPFYKLKKH